MKRKAGRAPFVRLLMAGCLVLESLGGCAHQELAQEAAQATDQQVFHNKPNLISDASEWGKPMNNLPEMDRYIASVQARLERFTAVGVGKIDVYDSPLVNGRFDWGTIDLTRGMLNACRNEAEVAAYIGHEIRHFQQFREDKGPKDSLFRKLMNQGLGYVTDTTGTLAEVRRQEDDIHSARQSQAREQDADEKGAELAAKAGYNPYALADLFDRLAAMVTTNPVLYKVAKLKGSHKALTVRAGHLRAYLAKKGYKNAGRLGAGSYTKGLASLAAYERASDPLVSPELAAELANFQKEAADHVRTRTPMSVPRFLAIMQRVAEINRVHRGLTERRRALRPTLKAFMEEALYMDRPSWSGFGGLGETLQGLLSTLGHLAVGPMPNVGSAAALYELLSGRDFVTGQDLGLNGRGLAAVGLLLSGAAVAEVAAAIGEAGLAAEEAAAAARALQVGEEMEAGIEASPTLSRIAGQSEFSTADFYVRPNGEIIPSQGYRYLSSGTDVEAINASGELPANARGTYVSFNDYAASDEAVSKLQLPAANDAAYKAQFDTQQLRDLEIPRGRWGTSDYLEPIAQDHPGFGEGGGTQAITRSPIRVSRVIDLRSGNVIYDAGGD